MPPRKRYTERNRSCFGSLVREKRLERGLTQKELGTLSHLRHDGISAIENGRKSVSQRKVMQLSLALGADAIVFKTAWRVDRMHGEIVGCR